MSKVKSKYIDFGLGTNQVKASDIPLDTTNFNNNLSTSDTNLQLALDTIDSMAGGGVAGSGSTADNAIARWDGTTGAAIQDSGCYIDDNGRLGVGISSPSNTFEISSESGAGFKFVENSSAAGAYLKCYRSLGTKASPTALTTDSAITGLVSYGYDGTSYSEGGSINIITSQDWTSSAQGNYIQFVTIANNATARVERMRITDTGRIGIGTTSPTARLHVCDESNTMASFYQYNDVDGAALRLHRAKGSMASPTALLSGDVLGAIRGLGYDGTSFSRTSNVDFVASENWTTSAHGTFIHFGVTPNGSTALAEGMRLTQDKYLGIGGVTTPAAGLDIESYKNNIPVKFGGTSGVISNYWYNSTSSHYCTNLYYDNSSSSWKFGKGSSSQYGAIYKMAGANGSHQWYATSAAGNADATASPTQIMTLSQAGVLDAIGGYKTNGVAGTSLLWSTVTTATTAVVGNAYITNNESTRIVVTLPASATVGDTIKIVGRGAAGWQLSAPASNYIAFGNQLSTSGGYLASTHFRDVVEVVYYATNYWTVVSGVGNLTVA